MLRSIIARFDLTAKSCYALVCKHKSLNSGWFILIGVIISLGLGILADWYMCTYTCISELHRNWILFILIFLANFLIPSGGWNHSKNRKQYYEDYKSKLDLLSSLIIPFLLLVSQFNLLGKEAEMIFSFILIMALSQLFGLYLIDFKYKISKQ